MLFPNMLYEKIFLPLGDLISGQSIYSKFNFLKESQYWSDNEIKKFQNNRLKIVINHSYEYVPYYKNLFNKLNLKPNNFQDIEDLSKLPILTKQMIKSEGIENFTSILLPKSKMLLSSSSGSTGAPLFYYRNKDAYSVNLAANLRGWTWMGFNLGDRFMVLSQNSRKDKLKKIQDKMSNNLFLATNPLIDSNFEFILKEIERYKPKYIRCYPDPLLFLARYKQSHPQYKYTPKCITTTGNTLHLDTRKEIEETFGCKIFDSYSCEGNSNVFECETHECYHSSAEYGISEFLDDNNKPIKDGIARLISTDLWNLAHPFIRYETGDIVEVSNEICSCGRVLPRINRILGRDNDVLTLDNGRKFIVHNFTGFFSVDHKEINRSVDLFQIVQKKNGNFIFRLKINNNFNNEARLFIQNYWEKEFKVPIEIEIVEEIPLTKSGKRKFIIKEID